LLISAACGTLRGGCRRYRRRRRRKGEPIALDESATPTSRVSLSVVVPVFNERFLVRESVSRVLSVRDLPGVERIEVIVVDDGSTDGTREILRALAAEHPERIRYIEHPRNMGKGAAVRTGIAACTGDLVVFHDADLEYDPRDFVRMVRPILEDGADVVYGSRFLPSERRRVLYYRHSLGNWLLTALSNWFTDLNLSDMETCYKMFKAPLLKSIPIRSNSFGIEPEITLKIAKRHANVFEVPISYLGRTYHEGKKIGWRDGVIALGTLLRFWLVDDAYADDEHGAHILQSLERAHRFNAWMADAILPFVGSRVLEIGAGIGNITTQMIPRDHYLATDIAPHYLDYLRSFALSKPYLEVRRIDLQDPGAFTPLAGRFDTVICLNVLEHVADPIGALRNMHRALGAGGRLILYVPQGQGLYSSLDEVLGHRCRYSAEQLRRELVEAGFVVERLVPFNRAGTPGWYLNGRVLRRTRFDPVQMKVFNQLVPIVRRIDRFLPWPALGLIAVARVEGSGKVG
jgi:2-polyprenyl-3-methyl-5-hydroxy-6-metoxy-1,4-benzoquinol methylase